ncbi:hypothetical protein ASG49_11335 [Marmoricola sp. Leaf446]|uniref:hypothetical protein n=1 Tax=Marmoricola sp. Leaf446 TaxID=1736379 RepID=UPI0006FC641B|nr:hypothetical protein [Marmoricola sp. Leaf446]KQT91592.1 hypothetical protein ASG49_11335 [Marmoricola sp. Leaf446]
MSAADRAVDRARAARRRWRRATGADSLAHAARRVELGGVAVDEEVHLMTVLDRDLLSLEETVAAVASRRLGRSS